MAEVIAFYGFMGDCPWQHGFWVCAVDCVPPSPVEVIITIINPNATYSSAVVEGMFCDTGEQISTCANHMICASGDYLWFTISNSDYTITSPPYYYAEDWIYVYCISRDLTVVVDSLIVNSYSYYYASPKDTNRGNGSHITNMEFLDNLTMQIDYWVATGPSPGAPDNGYYAQRIITVPDPNTMSTFEPSGNSFSLLTEDIIATQQECILSLTLFQNPITGTAALNFSTPDAGHATVQVFDLSGRTVDTLVNEEVAAGNHSVGWTPENISSGVYFVRLTTAAGTVSTQAMVLR